MFIAPQRYKKLTFKGNRNEEARAVAGF